MLQTIEDQDGSGADMRIDSSGAEGLFPCPKKVLQILFCPV